MQIASFWWARPTLLLLAFAAVGPANVQADEALRSALKIHCFRCHGDGEVNGDVNFAAAFAAKPAGLAGDLELIEQTIDALESGAMPPEDEKQPTSRQRSRWAAELKRMLNEQLAKQSALPGIPLRRMTRFEYNNAVKALFELQRDAFALPERTVRDMNGYFKPASGKMPATIVAGNRAMGKSQFIGAGNTLPGVAAYPRDSRAEHGFDNRGDHLSLSPVLMESFFALSQSILNSREFPAHSKAYKSLFVAPDGASPAQLREDGGRRLRAFLRRAFRSDVTDETVDRYHGYFLKHLEQGRPFDESMKATVSAVLVSPRFLYIYSRPTDETETSDDFALATRLSLFLWGSIPDDQLLDLASQGKLRQPQVLAAQIDRMLNDARLKNFCDNFPRQWLQLDAMVSAVPDNKRFRDYYFGGANGMIYMVGMHMMIEPLLVFETVLVEDRPVTDLIAPDFTYQSDMLRRWYEKQPKGRAEVVGIRFQRRPLDDRRWGGVITNAAVLTMTSSPLRTKPITRGAWLATTIFNDPPQPPPADVPEIEDDDEKLAQQGTTLRDKLKAHIANQQCAACHQKIDPLGFALENYDAVGRWREQYRGGLPVDSSGKLFGRREFDGAAEFKDAILAEKERFARALAGHLLSYGLGRHLAPADRPSLDRIVANSAKDDYRFRTMIKQVVLSRSFTDSGTGGKENP